MMSYEAVKNLEPREFFRWFCEISRIPRDSGKEAKVLGFLEEFAAQRNIPCQKDDKGNLLMILPASQGYENEPAVLFQAHVDMVCRKEEGCAHDFENDPIDLYIDGNTLRARGTTLGADNAVGVATMLALADDAAIPHPMLELLFTVEEETGMHGIRAFDVSKLVSRRMINMDCGDSHVLCVSSAGRIACEIRKEFATRAVSEDETVIRMTASGGKGGHSGIDANRGRACAANTLGDLLLTVADSSLCLCALQGSNAIMKEATAVFAVAKSEAEAVKARLTEAFQKLRTVYARTDEGLTLEFSQAEAACALQKEDSYAVSAVLSILRTGQHRADGMDHNTMVSSGAITEIRLQNGQFALDYGVRSTLDAEQEALFRRYEAIVRQFAMELTPIRSYSGWAECPESPFRKKFQTIHTRLFGEEMELERAGGGIETCVITAQLPDMDAVGVAPTARGAHTTGEHLFLSEVAPYWELIKAVLAEKEA